MDTPHTACHDCPTCSTIIYPIGLYPGARACLLQCLPWKVVHLHLKCMQKHKDSIIAVDIGSPAMQAIYCTLQYFAFAMLACNCCYKSRAHRSILSISIFKPAHDSRSDPEHTLHRWRRRGQLFFPSESLSAVLPPVATVNCTLSQNHPPPLPRLLPCQQKTRVAILKIYEKRKNIGLVG